MAVHRHGERVRTRVDLSEGVKFGRSFALLPKGATTFAIYELSHAATRYDRGGHLVDVPPGFVLSFGELHRLSFGVLTHSLTAREHPWSYLRDVPTGNPFVGRCTFNAKMDAAVIETLSKNHRHWDLPLPPLLEEHSAFEREQLIRIGPLDLEPRGRGRWRFSQTHFSWKEMIELATLVVADQYVETMARQAMLRNRWRRLLVPRVSAIETETPRYLETPREFCGSVMIKPKQGNRRIRSALPAVKAVVTGPVLAAAPVPVADPQPPSPSPMPAVAIAANGPPLVLLAISDDALRAVTRRWPISSDRMTMACVPEQVERDNNGRVIIKGSISIEPTFTFAQLSSLLDNLMHTPECQPHFDALLEDVGPSTRPNRFMDEVDTNRQAYVNSKGLGLASAGEGSYRLHRRGTMGKVWFSPKEAVDLALALRGDARLGKGKLEILTPSVSA